MYVAAVWLVAAAIAVYVPPELVLRYTVYAVAPLTVFHEMVMAPAELLAVRPVLGAAGVWQVSAIEPAAEEVEHDAPIAVI